VDGEETISVQRRINKRWYCYDPYLAIANSHFQVLDYIIGRIRLGSLRGKGNSKGHFGKKQMYSLWFSNRYARTVIRALYPYLIVKKPQARLVLDMLKRGGTYSPQEEIRRKTQQEKTYQELKIIHGRSVN